MEDVPPSYESAITRDVWAIVAPWIPSRDLCAASLVSRKWHEIFAPFLWGDPASHFGTENDAVYVALTRFKRALKRVRPSVRRLTHTLHLPPALSEIYGGPNAFWLRDVLDYLPNLQSLLVSRLPFFDHQSLIALRQRTSGPSETDANVPTPYGLRLLIATREPNTTSIGLAEALSHFTQLVYLDLSYTSPARDASVLLALSRLQDLRVVKLRSIGLRDSEAEVLANGISSRVCVLDVRDNLLTDMAIRSLMQACFFPTERLSQTTDGNHRLDDWPVGLPPGPDLLSLDVLRSEDLDEQLLAQLTKPLTGRLAVEDIPDRGLTHLYISGNRISVEGLSSLLKSNRLNVLDAGTADTVKTVTRTRSTSSPNRHVDQIRFPGAEKLIPILAGEAGAKLTYLRINHAVITTKPEAKEVSSVLTSPSSVQPVELATDTTITELPGSSRLPVELSASKQIFELSADPPEPRAELPGDVIHFALSPPIGEQPSETDVGKGKVPVRRGSGAFAPKPATPISHSSETTLVSPLTDTDRGEVVLNATGTGLSARRSIFAPEKARTAVPNSIADTLEQSSPSSICSPTTHRQTRINELLQKRKTLIFRTSSSLNESKLGDADFCPLHPSSLPHVRTLILTDIPSQVPESSLIPNALRTFISACADESQLSFLLAKTNYSLPPGPRLAAEIRHAKSLFALETLILEVSNGTSDRVAGSHSWQHSQQRNSFSKSSTGDRDSEALWTAAASDFSFFGESGEAEEEMGIYRTDVGKYDFFSTGSDGMIPVTTEDENPSADQENATPARGSVNRALDGDNTRHGRQGVGSRRLPDGSPIMDTTTSAETQTSEKLIDVIAALSSFRKAQKAEFENAMARWREDHERLRSPISPLTPVSMATLTSDSISTSLVDLPFVPGYWKGEIKVIRPSPVPAPPASSWKLSLQQRERRIMNAGLASPRSQLSPRFDSGQHIRSGSGSNQSSPAPSIHRSTDSRSVATITRERELEEEGTQTLDYYGNRFEGGYLYP